MARTKNGLKLWFPLVHTVAFCNQYLRFSWTSFKLLQFSLTKEDYKLLKVFIKHKIDFCKGKFYFPRAETFLLINTF